MDLIKQAKQDSQAFVQLYEAYVERVYQYFLRRTASVVIAEDLLSQTWEKALTSIHKLKAEDEIGFLAWLFTIARNEFGQYFRKTKNKEVLEFKEEFGGLGFDGDKKLDNYFNSFLIKECLPSLSSKQREVVELRFFADLKNKEIAKILRLSEKTVASNLSRALQNLKKLLKSSSNSVSN